MPLALRAATWSCMSEMSGETTMVNPPRTSAGRRTEDTIAGSYVAGHDRTGRNDRIGANSDSREEHCACPDDRASLDCWPETMIAKARRDGVVICRSHHRADENVLGYRHVARQMGQIHHLCPVADSRVVVQGHVSADNTA